MSENVNHIYMNEILLNPMKTHKKKSKNMATFYSNLHIGKY
jgi:hypothetical protein